MMVDGTFEVSKQALERQLRAPLRHCAGQRRHEACESPIAQQRTIMLMSSDRPNDRATLIGCYYFHQQ